MKSLFQFAVVVSLLASGSAFASGWLCESQNGFNVKVYNHTDPNKGTNNPAVFILANQKGTLLVAKDDQILKRNLAKHVQYTVAGNGDTVWSDWVILQVQSKGGATRVGQKVKANLIFSGPGSHKIASPATCRRYKKN